MRKKNDELLKLMEKIELEKPVGWGFSKKKQVFGSWFLGNNLYLF